MGIGRSEVVWLGLTEWEFYPVLASLCGSRVRSRDTELCYPTESADEEAWRQAKSVGGNRQSQ